MGILYAILGQGELEHRLLIGITVGLAMGRLAYLVAKRVGGEEDKRYQELRRRWREKGREQGTFFVFYQAQALIAVLLSLPFLAAAYNDHDGLELARVARSRGLARRRGARGRLRPSAHRLPARRGQQGQADRRRALALLAAPELLRPVAHVVRLRADRARGAVGLGRPPLAAPDALPHPPRHRRPADGAGDARVARRRLPRATSAGRASSSRCRSEARDRARPRSGAAAGDPRQLRAAARRRAGSRRAGAARLPAPAARGADRAPGREAERAALRGAGRPLQARARPAAQVLVLPLAHGCRVSRRGGGRDARAHLRARRRRGRDGDPRPRVRVGLAELLARRAVSRRRGCSPSPTRGSSASGSSPRLDGAVSGESRSGRPTPTSSSPVAASIASSRSR